MTTKAQKQIEKWNVQLRLDREALLKTPGFCRVAWRTLEMAGLFQSSFAGEQSHNTAFNEGMRSSGLRFLAELTDANPNALALLQAHAMPATPPEKDDVDE